MDNSECRPIEFKGNPEATFYLSLIHSWIANSKEDAVERIFSGEPCTLENDPIKLMCIKRAKPKN